jgi:hypothetical protein
MIKTWLQIMIKVCSCQAGTSNSMPAVSAIITGMSGISPKAIYQTHKKKNEERLPGQ